MQVNSICGSLETIVQKSDKVTKRFSITELKDQPLFLRHLTTMRSWDEFKTLEMEVRNKIAAEQLRIDVDGKKTILPFIERFAIVLMRSKQNLAEQTLQVMYNCSLKVIQNCISALLPIVATTVFSNVKLDRDLANKHTPLAFAAKYPHCKLQMDCTYVFLQKSANFALQKWSFSWHKKRNLVKWLIATYPDGFLAGAWGPYPDIKGSTITKHVSVYFKKNNKLFICGDLKIV